LVTVLDVDVLQVIRDESRAALIEERHEAPMPLGRQHLVEAGRVLSPYADVSGRPAAISR